MLFHRAHHATPIAQEHPSFMICSLSNTFRDPASTATAPIRSSSAVNGGFARILGDYLAGLFVNNLFFIAVLKP